MKPAKVDIAAQSMSLDVLERNVEEGEGNIIILIFYSDFT